MLILGSLRLYFCRALMLKLSATGMTTTVNGEGPKRVPDRKEGNRAVKTLELRKATGSLAAYVGDAQKGPVVFTVKGDLVAALVPVTNADLEAVFLGSNRRFLRLIERSRSTWKTK